MGIFNKKLKPEVLSVDEDKRKKLRKQEFTSREKLNKVIKETYALTQIINILPEGERRAEYKSKLESSQLKLIEEMEDHDRFAKEYNDFVESYHGSEWVYVPNSDDALLFEMTRIISNHV